MTDNGLADLFLHALAGLQIDELFLLFRDGGQIESEVLIIRRPIKCYR